MSGEEGRPSVSFDDRVEVHEVVSYSMVYGRDPRDFVFGAEGMIPVNAGCCPYTGLPWHDVRKRRVSHHMSAVLGGKVQRQLQLEQVELQHCEKQLADSDGSQVLWAIDSRMGGKRVKKAEIAEETSPRLSAEDATEFRALCARANYLAQGRPDLAFACKELCREMSSPSEKSWSRLVRMVKHILGEMRIVYEHVWQDPVCNVDVFTDTGHAGCLATRRSTSGGAIMMGRHLCKHWSSTQATIALSSGEAELIGVVKGASRGMGFRSLACDLGLSCDFTLWSDASAAIGICRRKGLGKIRHLEVSDLWIQDKLRAKDFKLCNVDGKVNPAELFTKHLSREELGKHCSRLHLFPERGRAVSAPRI